MKNSLLTALTLLLCHALIAQTTLSGEIGGTTLTKANSPYVISGTVTVSQGTTLTIAAGVEIQSHSPYDLIQIFGTVKANGTAADSVRFTGFANTAQNPNFTHGGLVSFEQSSTASVLKYCVFDKMGETSVYGKALNIYSSSFSLTNSSIRNSEGMGIYVDDVSPTISSNKFNNNATAINIGATTISPTISGDVFNTNNVDIYSTVNGTGGISNCANTKIYLKNSTVSQSVQMLKPGTNSYYYLQDGGFSVSQGTTLTIAAGVEIQSHSPYDLIQIFGTVKANGTAADSVRFTGFANTAQNPNFTHGGLVSFEQSSTASVLKYCVFDKMGETSVYGKALNIYSSSFSLTNSSIRNTEGRGIYIGDGAPTISKSVFNNNAIGIDIGSSGILPTISLDTFNYNTKDIQADVTELKNISNCTNAKIYLWYSYVTQSSQIPKPGSNSYYVLQGGFDVSQGDTLTIQPGVEIQSHDAGDVIWVYGTLKAVGTAADSIRFTGFANTTQNAAFTHGGTLWFDGSSTNSALQYCAFDRMGDTYYGSYYYGQAMKINTGSFSISNSSIRNSEGAGISITTTGISPTISQDVFSNNTGDIEAYVTGVGNISGCTNTKIYLWNSSVDQSCKVSKPGTNSYYILQGGFTISQGDTLTIQPGVEIQSYDASDVIWIYGTLKAIGTATDSIRFTGFANTAYNPNYTHGGTLWFDQSSTNSSLQYCAFDRMGDTYYNYSPYYGQAIKINTGSFSISNSNIRNSEGTGININAGGISPVVSAVTFSNNPASVSVYPSSAGGISNCTNATIHIINSSVDTKSKLPKPGTNSFYYLDGGFTISQGDTLTIDPDVEIQSHDAGDVIWVYGTLKAIGTAADSIRFTGFANTTQNAAFTHGGTLWFDGSSTNSALQYCAFDRMGDTYYNYSPYYGQAMKINTGSFSISNSSVRNSEGTGVYVTSGSPVLTNNSIYNNGYGVLNNGSEVVDARYCYWGDSTGPYHPTLNTTGKGNQVSDNVNFIPFEKKPLSTSSGLIAYYPFNGSAADQSGNANNGTVNGATLATDRFGNPNSAYSFNGNGNYISLPSLSALDGAAGLSVSLWVKSTGLNNTGNAQFLISRGRDRDNGHFKVDLTDNSTNSYFIGGVNSKFGSGKEAISAHTYPIPADRWHHVVMSYDKTNISLYVDDTLSSQTPYTANLAANSSPVLIGKHIYSGFEYYTNGLIDDIVIYNKGISKAIVDSLYGNYNPAFTKGPDLAIQNVTSNKTTVAPNDSVTVSWTVANGGTATLIKNWTENIYIQSTDGLNRLLVKQTPFVSSGTIGLGQTLSRTDGVRMPAQLNVGDQGVFAVEIIPDTSVHESPGTNGNNTGVQTTAWTIVKQLGISLTAVQITEGASGTVATVTRTGSLTSALTVTISLKQPQHFSFSSPVTIPAGQAATTFTITAPNNTAVEGTITDTVTAAASGFTSAKTGLTLLDDDHPTLSFVNLPDSATEGQTVIFRVAVDLAPATPLQVYLVSSNQARFPLPASVTIPAGNLYTNVTVTLPQNKIPEISIPVTITAGAGEDNPASDTIQVNDDDVPSLALIIQTNTISEGAGQYATQGILRRTSPDASIAFTANLSTDLDNTFLLPYSISLDSGETEKTFNIGVIDNSAAEGSRTATITASIFVASCGCNVPPASSGYVSAPLTITDNDGPTLTLSSGQLTYPEGVSNAGYLRITRNTPTQNALTVMLTSSDTTEATLPKTVIIPGGQMYLDVPITTINDNIVDGTQPVYLQATANGLATGSLQIYVTDQNKPDLQITAVQVSSNSVVSAALINYQVSVKNIGFATAVSNVVVKAYLSTDGIIDGNDSLVSAALITTPIPVSQTAQLQNTITIPNLLGQYQLLFKVNPDTSITELLYTNNESEPVSLTITPAYTAAAIVSPLYVLQGTTVPVTGTATKTTDGTVAAYVKVEVHVITDGLRREITATTDGTGHFTAQFVPLTNEAGHYTAGAAFPGLGDTTSQDAFDILGVKINGEDIPQFKVTLHDTLKGSLLVQNLSNKSLTNFSLLPVSLPAGAYIHFDTVAAIAGNASTNIHYLATGSSLSPGNNFEVASLQAKASEGVIQNAYTYYYCQAPSGYIAADINNVDITVSQSKGERQVEFKLINKGQAASGNISINLPRANWISNVTPKVLFSLKAGDTAIVIVKFLATADVPFNYPITGTIGVVAQSGNSFNIPFTFQKVSDTSGIVQVTATDEFTYNAQGSPNVAGAHVTISNYYNNTVYADGYTDASGVFTIGKIPEGIQKIVIEKNKHNTYSGTISVNVGDTSKLTAFLSYQAITFSWSVVPTTVQDQYTVTLQSQFETNVPVPVVTIEMPETMPQLAEGEQYTFNATLTNHGLITAKDVAINLPTDDPEYEFVTNYVSADLAALQSIQVPVIMRHRSVQSFAKYNSPSSIASISSFLKIEPVAGAVATQGSVCKGFAGVVYWYYCELSTGLWQTGGVLFSYSGRVCTGIGTGGIYCSDCGGIIPTPHGVWWYNGTGPKGPVFPPCANCPHDTSRNGNIDNDPPPPPKVEIDKKSCVKCINDIAKTLAGCAGGKFGDKLADFLCFTGVWLGNGGPEELVECLPNRSKEELLKDLPVINCLEHIKDAIESCSATETAGGNLKSKSVNSVSGGVSDPTPNSAFKEIADNFQVVINAYQAREDWAKEYFGDMIYGDSWNDLYPLLENYTVNLDSIQANTQSSILNAMAGYEITPQAIQAFFDRWNTSLYARSRNILEPDAEFPNIINWELVKSYSDSMISSTNYALSKNYSSVYNMYDENYASLNELLGQQQKSVCASVTVQFSQQLTFTREAFAGTLNIFNGHPTDAMDSLSVNITITDVNGVPSNGLFEIQTDTLINVSNITGTGNVNAQQTGTVKFIFIPENGAAPTAPKVYNFGGSIRYWDPYAQAMVTFPLASVPITVNPSPNLTLHYFMQRNILGDDPLTSPAIEPSVPAELAVMVENHGYSSAVNTTISSSQPQIVDNKKGLAIDFSLVGSNFQGQPTNFGVTDIDFGTIPAQQARTGEWYFTSTLLGRFVSYSASVVHDNSFGNPDLSLVDTVELHELTKSIREYGASDDSIHDFLVNDLFDVNYVPDIIYFSQGNRTSKVYQATAGSFSAPVSAPTYTNTLSVTASKAGWNYIKLDDPGYGLYDIVSITRNDSQAIPLDNAWLTFVTLPTGGDPVYENKFHFVDTLYSLTPATYTVVWKPKNLDVPKVDTIIGAPQQDTNKQVTTLIVKFNKSIDISTFTYRDLTLLFQATSVMDSSVVITQVDSSTFNVNISTLTHGSGYYVFTVQAADITDVYGIKGISGKQVSWNQHLNDDCNGQPKTVYYRDADGDGYGSATDSTQSCTAVTGYVTNKRDCDDTKTSVHPGAPEICDGLDNDCNGLIDDACFAPPIARATTTAASACLDDGTIKLSASGGKSPYQYSIDGIHYSTTATFTGLAAGTYIGYVKDSRTAVDTVTAKVTKVSALVVTSTVVSASACLDDGKITLGKTGGTTPYTYSLDGINYSTIYAFANLAAGTYKGYVKDAKGCTAAKENIIVGRIAAITVTGSTTSASNCLDDGKITLSRTAGGTSPYTYSLNDLTYTATNIFSNLAAGMYTGYVKDAKGCKGRKDSIVVAKLPEMVVKATPVSASACLDNGTITLSKTNGTSPFTYSLDGIHYVSTYVFSGIATGMYKGYVKDAKGCIAIKDSIVVSKLPAMVVSSTIVSASTCLDDGKITLSRTNGTSPYTYSLDGINYVSTYVFSGLVAGSYTGYVKDAKGCIATKENIVVGKLPNIVVSYTKTNASKCPSNGSITLTKTGGTSPFSYSLDGTTYTSSYKFSNLAPGTYKGYVKDAKGCVAMSGNIVITGLACSSNMLATIKVDNIAEKPTVSVVPNPARSWIQAQLSGFRGKTVIQLHSVDGKILRQAEVQTFGQITQQSFDVADLSDGTYLLTVIDDKGNIINTKVVVVR